MLLGLVAGIGALGWNQYTWHRAVRQLEEAGITADPHEHLGARLWRTAKADWRKLFKAGPWRAEPIWWEMAPDKAGQLRVLDALAPALRRINPEVLILNDCPALQNVDGLKGLPALQGVRLPGCQALQNVDGLKGLPALGFVDLGGSTKLPPEQVAALKAAFPKANIPYP